MARLALASVVLCASLLLAGLPAGASDVIQARKLFGKIKDKAPLTTQAIGAHARGCLAGAVQLPKSGPGWIAMRTSRNRHWGHPRVIRYVKKLARDATEKDDWPGLLVGDISQPRGGPMSWGHRSHQIGLDVDIWLRPAPDQLVTDRERERLKPQTMLRTKYLAHPKRWTDKHFKLIKRAASYVEVERIFLHPALKRALCLSEMGDARWLRKVRPYFGHKKHFHVRLHCVPGDLFCRSGKPLPPGDGCGQELEDWYDYLRRPRSTKTNIRPTRKPRLRMPDLPAACRTVLHIGTRYSVIETP